jgi:XTP/dITP diphosphohydrolase
MRKIVFATNNPHKLEEVSNILETKLQITSLKEIGLIEEIPETSNSIEGNALQKAQFVFDRYGIPCFADDTGLEVDALGGAPGVYSARYAGENASYADNVKKLLQELEGVQAREARFKTVIAYIDHQQTKLFEGVIEGRISNIPSGKGGFGYDPVFIPAGYDQSFAEMSLALKNSISHRALATQLLVTFLLKQ